MSLGTGHACAGKHHHLDTIKPSLRTCRENSLLTTPSNLCLSCQPPCLSWSLGVLVSPLCLYVFLSESSIHTPGHSISLCLYPSVSILLLPIISVPPFGLPLFPSRSHLATHFPTPVLLLSLGAYLSLVFLVSPSFSVSSSPPASPLLLSVPLPCLWSLPFP